MLTSFLVFPITGPQNDIPTPNMIKKNIFLPKFMIKIFRSYRMNFSSIVLTKLEYLRLFEVRFFLCPMIKNWLCHFILSVFKNLV